MFWYGIYQLLECSPEEELLPMWLTTLMSLKELAKSPLCGLQRLYTGYYESQWFSVYHNFFDFSMFAVHHILFCLF